MCSCVALSPSQAITGEGEVFTLSYLNNAWPLCLQSTCVAVGCLRIRPRIWYYGIFVFPLPILYVWSKQCHITPITPEYLRSVMKLSQIPPCCYPAWSNFVTNPQKNTNCSCSAALLSVLGRQSQGFTLTLHNCFCGENYDKHTICVSFQTL